MSTGTVYQFVAGFIVGAVLCICTFGRWQYSKLSWDIPDTNQMGVPIDVLEISFLARMFKGSLNHANRSRDTAKGYKMPIDDMKNKTMITCIVPLLRDFGHTDQLESGIVVTWIKFCDHVVFLRNRTLSRLDKGIQHSLKTLQYRARSKMKTSVSYFYIPKNMTETTDNNSVIVGDVTKTDDNTSEDMSWLMYQFKAIEFAFQKYSDTNIFIVTPSVKDIIKYFYKHVNGHSDDKQLERLQKFLRTDVSFELTVLKLDECLVLGRKAVSKLIKMTNLKPCSFKNQRVLFEWAEQCIGS